MLYVITTTRCMLAYCGHCRNLPLYRSENVVTLDKAAMLWTAIRDSLYTTEVTREKCTFLYYFKIWHAVQYGDILSNKFKQSHK
jgi:hypothetical protein